MKIFLPIRFGLLLIHLLKCEKQIINSKIITITNRTYTTRYTLTNMTNFSVLYSKKDILDTFNKIIPPLTFDYHKGQAGRIGVVGGSEEYTGAPYFAGITALKVGADLSHIICSKSASPVIKSYSPELIVHPLLDQENRFDNVAHWISRFHSVVIGPGLGRDPKILKTTQKILENLISRNIPVVIDADGLFLVTQNPEIIHGYKKAVLTPNVVEFQRLLTAMNITSEYKDDSRTKQIDETIALSTALGDVIIIRKGPSDIIARGNNVAVVEETGSPRRCGGQGDLLSGATNVFLYWAFRNIHQNETKVDRGIAASYAACLLTRRCAALAFEKHGRSTTTTDLIAEIESVFQHSKL